MSHLVPILALLVVIGIIAAVIKALTQKGKAPATYPYEKEPVLFTPAERLFLGVLDQAIGTEFRIMGKVRLADVIKVKTGMDRGTWQKAFNRIQSKHLDFVCCDPNDLSVQFAVELDDKSHERADRQERDGFLGAALEKAGVPLVRFPAKRAYSVEEIREAIIARLTPPAMAAKPQSESPASVPAAASAPASAAEAPACRACGTVMVRRKASRGQNAGQEFWGCSNYPKCREVVAIA